MADEIDFPYGLPIGYGPDGAPISANLDFWDNLIRLLNRTGGSGANFIADALAAAASAEATADGKITSVWQDAPPTVGDYSEGDLWFDTNDGNKCYQLRSGAWVNAQDSAIGTAISAAAGAQTTANSRITTFYQTSAPTALAVGDLWHDTDDSQRRTYRWNGGTWQNIADQTPFNTAAAITGQGALATLSLLVAQYLAAGVGMNRVKDPLFRRGGSFWSYTFGSGPAYTDSQLETTAGLRRFKRAANSTPTAGQFQYWGNGAHTNGMAIGGGERIEVQTLVGGVGIGDVGLYVQWFKADGTQPATTESLAQYVGSNAVEANGSGEGALSTFYTMRGFVTAPSDARFALILVLVYWDGAATPYFNVARPYIGIATAGQTEFTPYHEGFDGQPGADITASNIAASVTGQGPGATVAIPTYAGNAAALTGGLLPGATFIDSSDSNKLKSVQPASGGLSVTLSRYSQSKTRSGAGTTSSDSYAATVTGGSGTYEYDWERYSGDGTIDAPTSSSTSFSQTVGTGESKVGKFRLTVRDTSTGASAIVVASYRLTETS